LSALLESYSTWYLAVVSPSTSKTFALVALACALAVAAWSAKKKKEDETQTLQLPKELPSAVVGDTRRLAFYVTPLSAKGLLSQQIRDALKALDRQAGGNTVLKIRAFVAGSGDLRRVRDLVSETFTERKQPLPALSLIQAGGLPLEGAQVVLEGIAGAKKDLYPGGLALVSAQAAVSANPLDPVAPLAEKSLAALRQAAGAAGAQASDVLRVTCFLSSLENLAATRRLVQADYARAALNFVQTQRAPPAALAACEAVAGLRSNAGSRLQLLNPEGLPRVDGQSQMALVGSRRVVLTGTQVSFGYEEQDARLAFERLRKALEPLGASLQDVAFAHFYPLSRKIEDQVRAARRGFFAGERPPAGSLLLVEGLSSLDAGFAVDVVAAKD
jgi:enamine deaminase RidA (YjgF/YER057c/UK114 family)